MADPATPSLLSISPGPLSHEEMDRRWIGEDGTYFYDQALKASQQAAEKQRAIAEGLEKRRPQEEAETERAIGGVETAIAQPRPGIPSQERVPSPPKPEDYHKMSLGYLGAMVLLGAFGGKFIRNAANAPLAAFNGALTGWQEGNLEAYKEKSEEWKQKQQQVLDNNRARLDEYKLILEDRDASIEDQVLRAKLVAAKHQDKIMYDRLDAGNWNGFAQAYDQMVNVHEKAVAATDKLVDQQTAIDATAVPRANLWKQYLDTPEGQQYLAQRYTPAQQFRIKGFVESYADQPPAQLEPPGPAGGSMPTEPPPGTAMPTAAAGTARLPADLRGPMPPGLKPADMAARQFRIDSYNQGKGEPSAADWASFNRQQHQPRSAAGMALQEFIEETRARTGADPTSDEIVQFQANQAAEVTSQRSIAARSGPLLVASAEWHRTMPLASRASGQVARGKFVPVNRLQNNVRLLRSDPKYQRFVDMNEAAITAYSATMSRSGANSVHAQTRADRVLSTATSDEAYQEGLRALEEEIVEIEKAPADARRTATRIFGPKGMDPEDGTAAGRAPVRVTTPEEAAKLPPGTLYVNPQGDHFTR